MPVARDGEKLRDLRALPDGTLCLLWSKNLGCDRDPALPQELRVQLGDDSYTLGFKQPMIGLNGTIVGFIERRPIINKFWFDYQVMATTGKRCCASANGKFPTLEDVSTAAGGLWKDLACASCKVGRARIPTTQIMARDGKKTLYDIDDSGGCLKEIERSVPNPARIQQLLRLGAPADQTWKRAFRLPADGWKACLRLVRRESGGTAFRTHLRSLSA